MKADLLGKVLRLLDGRGVPAALVGGMALAIHGVSRASFDFDLLCRDPRLLDRGAWTPLRKEGARIEIRRGDRHDPFVGLVRLSAENQADVRVLVGLRRWLEGVLERRQIVPLEDGSVPVVVPADLILLKLDAAGAQDLLDVRLLLRGPAGDECARDVLERLPGLPPNIERAWSEVRPS